MKFTPNAYRNAKKYEAELLVKYNVAKKELRRIVASGCPIIKREDAIGRAAEARFWYYTQNRRRVDMETAGIETGAAWSPQGLTNVRKANCK